MDGRTRDHALGLLNDVATKHPEGIWVTDKDDRLVFFNQSIENISGIKAQDALGRSVPDALAGEATEHFLAYYNRAKATLEPVEYEAVVVTPAGRRTIRNGWCMPRLRNNAYDGMICTTNDVTERKRAEEALRSSEERYRNLFENSLVGLFRANMNTRRIVAVNQCYADIVGYTREELVAQPTVTLWKDPEAQKRAIATLLELGELRNYELEVLCKGGAVKSCLVSLKLFREEGLVEGSVIDITERRRIDEELNRSSKLESLGLLAGGIAHEFNNLLGGIFGYIDLAAGESTDLVVSRYLEKAMETLDRARALTGQLLTFAKGGAPARSLQRLGPFIEKTAASSLSGSNVRCACAIPDGLWPCKFDRTQLRQAIDSIVTNARQAMPDGGTVEISAENLRLAGNAHADLPDGNYVTIAIKDSGVGMPKEILPRIFDPFFTTKAKGHGLGLSTCHSIITRHGGCIEVESEPGKGSTFTLYLPASPDASDSGADRSTPTHKGGGPILVMDDEEVIRETVGAMLHAMGYRVHCVSGSKEAIDLFEKSRKSAQPFAALILDLTIPGGPGGKETIRKIREIDNSIPAFVASGYADDPVMANPAEYGFSGSISKPFRKVDLAELLDKHLPRKRQTPLGRAPKPPLSGS